MGKQVNGSLLFVQFAESEQGSWALNPPIRKLFVSGYPHQGEIGLDFDPNTYIISLFRDFDLDFRDGNKPIRRIQPKRGGPEYCAGNLSWSTCNLIRPCPEISPPLSTN